MNSFCNITISNKIFSQSKKELVSWLGGIEKRLQGDDDIENRLIPFDDLSSQIVKLTAEYMVSSYAANYALTVFFAGDRRCYILH